MTTHHLHTFVRALAVPLCIALVASALLCQELSAQDVAVAVDNSVTIEGRVAKVYQGEDESLVQVLVQMSQATNSVEPMGRYPAPGQYVYIHVASGQRGGLFRRGSSADLPKSQDLVRVTLNADRLGQWVPQGEDWFEPAGSGSPSTAGGSLGLVTERISLGRDRALKVVRVAPNSPAAAAGIEPGDVLVEANRTRLESQQQLEEIYQRSPRGIALTVRDVRSGREVDVNVEPAGSTSSAPADRSRMQPLGAKTKLAFFKGNPALEISDVEANSPAARAGLQSGLLILEANGKSVESAEDLEAAERASRGQLELRVADPKSGRDQTVRIRL
jgi:membrane-associated protease RseP (regulator of RpoE activity)